MLDNFEKIKIAVPKEINKILDRDVESFEFLKKNLSLNKNSFINTLIVSYFEEFMKEEKEERKLLQAQAKKLHLTGESVDEYINQILKMYYMKYQKKEAYSENISFRPTKNSIYAIDYIENNLLFNTTLSDFFRRLFYRYCSLPQYQRERIIFKDKYQKILAAISDRKQVYISTRFNVGNRVAVSPYAFATVKEETYNYLLCKDEKSYRTFRLSKIQDCIVVDKEISFDENDRNHFEKMMKYGPQYLYLDSDEEAEVILTKKGQKYFKNFYVYRPIVDRIEGDHYFFKCSIDQLAQYFSRFGSECYVIRPNNLRLRLINYYKKAYLNLVKKEKDITMLN